MRAIWKGALQFGLVTIPVKLYTATEQKDIRFKLLHRTDHGPIKEKRFCTIEDREVEWDELVRGFEVSKGEFVVVDPEEIEAVQPESAHTIEIGDFVELEQIDPIYFEKTYFLEPTEIGVKPFNLLRRALEETERVAVARVVIRTKERLATVRVYDGTLVLETMYWPDEIRSAEQLEIPEARSRPGARELEMARTLVESLAGRFEPAGYEDRYRVALQELIERKMKGEQRAAKRRRPEPKVVDLMDALEASLNAARERRGAAADSSTRPGSERASSAKAKTTKPGSAGKPAARRKRSAA